MRSSFLLSRRFLSDAEYECVLMAIDRRSRRTVHLNADSTIAAIESMQRPG